MGSINQPNLSFATLHTEVQRERSVIMMQAKCLALVVVFGVARTSSYGISQDLCIPSGGDQVCSNHGNCVFGKCHCEDNWTGQFCTECADDSCSSRGHLSTATRTDRALKVRCLVSTGSISLPR